MPFDRERLAALLKRAQGTRSVRRFAAEAGLSSSYISRLLRQMLKDPPSPQALQKIADASEGRVSHDELMLAAGHMPDSLANLIRRWREESPYYKTFSDLYMIPILGSIRAGIPIEMIEDIEGYIAVDPLLLAGHEGFALRVKGDSMSGDRIYDGDIVIVRQQDTVAPHEIAVVAIGNEEATLKRVKFVNGQAVLLSSNHTYEPIIVPADQVRIIGKVIEVRFMPGRR